MVSILRSTLNRWRVNGVDELLDTEVDSNYEVYTTVRTNKLHHDLSWELVLIFNGSKNPYGEWISLQLKLPTEQKRVNVNFKIWMVTRNGTKIRMNHETMLEIDDTITYTIPDFINKDGLFVNYEEYVPKNVLTFVHEFDVESVHVIPRIMSKRDKMDQEEYDDGWSNVCCDSTTSPPKRMSTF
ncbi:uncharacterized protein LOC123264252 [Cotesia glomerata]|uniref:uncharacterized protein LOC123264252 n=1 Tax=Cotesia glomerata TaxID=32391 RepID=UPI001D019CB0|nr:uncharacterized protein LOC123264252 [Cotesia glomerata]XP_044583382.1 uncharacterized protein LOC123264252 [Cotesia glomerata]